MMFRKLFIIQSKCSMYGIFAYVYQVNIPYMKHLGRDVISWFGAIHAQVYCQPKKIRKCSAQISETKSTQHFFIYIYMFISMTYFNPPQTKNTSTNINAFWILRKSNSTALRISIQKISGGLLLVPWFPPFYNEFSGSSVRDLFGGFKKVTFSGANSDLLLGESKGCFCLDG